MWLVGVAVCEVDLERGACACPVVGLVPLLLGVDDCKVEQLAGCVVGGELSAGLDRFADLAVECLDRVRGVDHAA